MLMETLSQISVFVYMTFIFGSVLFILEIVFRLKNLAGICGIALVIISYMFTKSFTELLILLVITLVLGIFSYLLFKKRKQPDKLHKEQ